MTISTQKQEVIHFGKFKGTALEKLEKSYVRWLLTLETLDAALREKLNQLDWVQEELVRQRRKDLAIALQSSHIPSHERKAWRRSLGNRGWSNTGGAY